MSETRTIKVNYLTRVEGEGALYVKANGLELETVQLRIFEAPRFFEGFLRGRSYQEAPDITARICGICPVAYQMSSVHAIEDAFGVLLPQNLQDLRRLLYCGEWMESHALHIFMLHAPDFLGYPDAITMARDHKSWVETGLKIKRIGNKLLSILGGREIHPINIKVGGFYKLPDKHDLKNMRAELEWAYEACQQALRWVSTFTFPDLVFDYELVALYHPGEYPMNFGRIRSNKSLDIKAHEYEQHFEELHVAHSTALQSVHLGHGSYLTGPLARMALNFSQLPSYIQQLAHDVGFDQSCNNPYRSIQARGLELVLAFSEALRLIEAYDDTLAPSVAMAVQKGSGKAATEAPRGLLYHRYDLDDEGLIEVAKIIPPTSQNQMRIEDDLRQALKGQLARPDHEIADLCEKIIRNYDPCISCATHFLKLKVERH